MPSMLANLNLNQNEVQNAVAQNLASAPASPKKGQFYYDTSTNALYWWNNAAWVPAQSGGLSYGSPVASAEADTAADGVATTVARSDHRHAREAFGAVTAQTVFGGASSSGAALTPSRSDHVHGTPATPTALAVGAVANLIGTPSIGSGVTGSRPAAGNVGSWYLDTTTFLLYRDNGTTWDQIDGFGLPVASAVGAAQAAGTATTFSRSDHVHAREAFGTPGASAVGDVAAAGAATTVAHSDHVHAREAFGNVVAQTAFGGSSTNGALLTPSRSDHQHGTPVHDAAAHAAIPHSALAQPTAAVNWGAQLLSNLATPVAATDAATKGYVDATAAGIDFKASVRAASTVNVAVATALVNGLVMDGVTLATGDRVLLKDQSTAAENGIYVVVAAGAASRSTDADSTAELTAGALVFVESGTLSGGDQWVMTTTGAITLGTTPMAWTQFSGASALTAGAGLSASGNAFNVGAGNGIVVAADTISVDTAVVVRKYATLIGNGALTSITVTHNLNTQDVTVALYAAGSPFGEAAPDVQHTSVNTITLLFAVAPATNAYRCVVQG